MGRKIVGCHNSPPNKEREINDQVANFLACGAALQGLKSKKPAEEQCWVTSRSYKTERRKNVPLGFIKFFRNSIGS
jgi:hypothetical protein